MTSSPAAPPTAGRTARTRRLLLAVVLLVCLSLPWFLGRSLFRVVDGASMEPTLGRGTVVVMIPSALHGPVSRGDIAVLETTTWEPGLTVIKRVAGVEGDCVSQVVSSAHSPTSPCMDVRPDHLYVLGDNPARSSDSRQNGQIPASAVVGVVKCVLWPGRAIRCRNLSTSQLPEVR